MDGFYNVLKSTDMTSSDVVVKLRGKLRARLGYRPKVGHLGTLDPAGAGVLPIAVGQAVKLFEYMLDKQKVYRAEFVWGQTTDTLDSYGNVTECGEAVCDVERVLAAAKQWVGTYDQYPPQYSAKSVGGRRAYELARKGESVDLPPKQITVQDIRLVRHEGNAFTFDITCSSGTYIRSIARDIAQTLGTVGYMSYIIRLRSGPFVLEEARTLAEIDEDLQKGFLPLVNYAKTLPIYRVDERLRKCVENGIPHEYEGLLGEPQCICIGETPYGIGCLREGRLKIICKF